MKAYKFTFEDKKGNELKTIEFFCISKKEAIRTAKRLESESNINDLFKVKSKQIK
jgi:hypothetical protein